MISISWCSGQRRSSSRLLGGSRTSNGSRSNITSLEKQSMSSTIQPTRRPIGTPSSSMTTASPSSTPNPSNQATSRRPCRNTSNSFPNTSLSDPTSGPTGISLTPSSQETMKAKPMAGPLPILPQLMVAPLSDPTMMSLSSTWRSISS